MQKIPLLRAWTADNPMTEIVDELKPTDDDTIIVKKYPSSFFGTPLAAMLTALCVDTIILIGCSTSGCIRASALGKIHLIGGMENLFPLFADGMQHGFRMIVPKECVGDRHQAIHDSNLFDMNAKNADVVPKSDVMAHLTKIESQD